MKPRSLGGLVESRCSDGYLSHEILTVVVDERDVDELLPPVIRRRGDGREYQVAAQSVGSWTTRRRALGLGEDATKHHTLFTDLFGEGACIDAKEGRNAIFLQPFSQRGLCEEVAEIFRIVANDEGDNMDAGRFEVRWELVDVGRPLRDAVVADKRVRKNKNLALVGGIRQGFGISDHSCTHGSTRNVR